MEIEKDPRPEVYRYWDQLIKHIKSPDRIFDGTLAYPRQFEIHLPADHIDPCQLHCPHCAGKYFKKDLGNWEMDALELLDKLEGKIPYHIYGGAYTEPLMNPYFMTFLSMTKKHRNHFGIHTNGVQLQVLEDSVGFLTELNRISTDEEDYLSISLDAGTAESWCKSKGSKLPELFYMIIEGIATACEIRRENGGGHAIRVCYLINEVNDSKENIECIVKQAKLSGVDSLRFSIPFGNYNQSFDKIREYKKDVELPLDNFYRKLLEHYLSKDESERPYIFYTGPEFTDIDKFVFEKCAYGYYQITFGADGYVYKCSTTATPTMEFCRLGKITSDLNEFERMIVDNQNYSWSCATCFNNGARCNRMGLEINTEYANYESRSRATSI